MNLSAYYVENQIALCITHCRGIAFAESKWLINMQKPLLHMLLIALCIILGTPLQAQAFQPMVTGTAFDSLIAVQDTAFQNHVRGLFKNGDGYLMTGPMDPLFDGPPDSRMIYHSHRLTCPDHASISKAVAALRSDTAIRIIDYRECLTGRCNDMPQGYRGALLWIDWRGDIHILQLNSIQQTRWLIWAKPYLVHSDWSFTFDKLGAYADALADFLFASGRGWSDFKRPDASLLGLPDSLDFYRPQPDYVIEGYQNYKDFLKRHRPMYTDFARGVLSLVPSDSLLAALAADPPYIAYRNKEYRALQHEFEKFITRGGDFRDIAVLTKTVLDTLSPGEYLYAVGASGLIRFARELTREEVHRIEEQSGQKVPRINHAFLFPGEAILIAGAFFIEHSEDGIPYFHKINAQSGHYFYSNLTPTIRTDISEKSNTYILSLGHFFRALEREGISVSDALISKY